MLIAIVMPSVKQILWALMLFGVMWVGVLFLLMWLGAIVRNEKRVDACKAQACGYYTHYLSKGPAHLSHCQFHEAENSYFYWHERVLEECERPAKPCYRTRAAFLADMYNKQIRI